jgi:hypothetical protein
MTERASSFQGKLSIVLTYVLVAVTFKKLRIFQQIVFIGYTWFLEPCETHKYSVEKMESSYNIKLCKRYTIIFDLTEWLIELLSDTLGLPWLPVGFSWLPDFHDSVTQGCPGYERAWNWGHVTTIFSQDFHGYQVVMVKRELQSGVTQKQGFEMRPGCSVYDAEL